MPTSPATADATTTHHSMSGDRLSDEDLADIIAPPPGTYTAYCGDEVPDDLEGDHFVDCAACQRETYLLDRT